MSVSSRARLCALAALVWLLLSIGNASANASTNANADASPDAVVGATGRTSGTGEQTIASSIVSARAGACTCGAYIKIISSHGSCKLHYGGHWYFFTSILRSL